MHDNSDGVGKPGFAILIPAGWSVKAKKTEAANDKGSPRSALATSVKNQETS
jgi:hypothetical protein